MEFAALSNSIRQSTLKFIPHDAHQWKDKRTFGLPEIRSSDTRKTLLKACPNPTLLRTSPYNEPQSALFMYLVLSSAVIWLLNLVHVVEHTVSAADKCYSCSSAQLHFRWPKTDDNKLLYLKNFPFFSNETCDNVRDRIPVVPCPNSVCVKVVIHEPPPSRQICVQGPAIVRDCWSRIMYDHDEQFSLAPGNATQVRLTREEDVKSTVGHIYTCKGYLCNSAPSTSALSTLILSFVVLTSV
uniref:Protein quiver n=1 Tax=Steinernema glaseri TaxID=37863 RepID=A0A1I8A9F6_9BILA